MASQGSGVADREKKVTSWLSVLHRFVGQSTPVNSISTMRSTDAALGPLSVAKLPQICRIYRSQRCTADKSRQSARPVKRFSPPAPSLSPSPSGPRQSSNELKSSESF
jgi:hypothetical protein